MNWMVMVTASSLILHLCPFTDNGEQLYMLPMADVGALSQIFVEYNKMQTQMCAFDASKGKPCTKDGPVATGINIVISQDGCSLPKPGFVPSFAAPEKPQK